MSSSPDQNPQRDVAGTEQARIESLVAALGDFDDTRRFHARQRLVEIGKPAIPAMVRTLESANHLVRWGAVKTLSEIGDPDAAPALVKVLEDDVFDIRWIASEGLIGMGDVGLEPLLEALIHHSDRVGLREGAHRIIRALGELGMGQVLAPVLAALESSQPSKEVPPAARKALDDLRDLQQSPG